MHWTPSRPRRRTGFAVAALACAALFSPAPSGAAPMAPALTSPEARWAPLVVADWRRHGAVLDPVRDRLLVFGGESNAGFTNGVFALPLSGASGWGPLTATGGPLARRSAGVVYDRVRDRLLVFGGSDGTTTYNDLWALSLAGAPQWTFLGSGGALVPPREEHVTVYDATHDRLVIFGGIDHEGHILSDCWALPLAGSSAWSPLATSGPRPPARQSASGIYDPVRDRLLVFGGADSSGTLLSDTWALPMGAGDTWALVPLAGGEPVARERAAVAYDAGHDQMVVYGGRGASALQATVLTLSLAGTAVWNVPSSSTPSPAAREWAAAIVDPARDRLVVVGGGTPSLSIDVLGWALGGTHPWTTLTPGPRQARGHAVLRDPVRNRLLAFGGVDASNVANNALWSLDLGGPPVWTQLAPSGTPPEPRGYASAIYDAPRDRVLVFGGVNFSPFQVYVEVWALQLAGTPTWQLLSPTGTRPSARYLHSAIYDPVRDRMVVFGGTGGSTTNNEVWMLDLGGTPAWTFQPPDIGTPTPRSTHGAIYDPVRDRMVVSGGTDFTNVFTDTHYLLLAGTPHWHSLASSLPPSARYLAAWGYDPVRDRLLEYGGRNLAGSSFNEVWALPFDATNQWLQIQTAGAAPAARVGFCGAFDPPNDRFVFMSGGTSDVLSVDWDAALTSAPPASPLEIALSPPYPNPMRDGAMIRYVTTEPGPVEIAILDVSGRRVRMLEAEQREPGAGLLRWDGRDERGTRVAPGVYLVHMRSQGRLLSRRIVRTQ